MSEKINIFSDQWVEIVFQNKNKQYGAYDMRKSSSKRHAIALSVAIGFFLIAILSPILIKKLAENARDTDQTVRTLTKINLDKPKDKEIPKPLTPPPPPIRNTIKFVPPVITKDELVPEDEKPIINEEIVKTNTAISTADVKGGIDEPIPIVAQVAEVEEPFAVVEQMPEFDGGERALMNFVNANIRYPSIALENGVSGMVIVRFVVDKEGRVSNGTVLRGIGSGCDEEALRIIKKMPPWKPGKQGGRAVPVWFTLPIRFTLAQ